MNPSMFTILPNELVTMVFEYLNPFDIIYSFSNLNHRFDVLIAKYKENVNLCDLSQSSVQKLLPLINKHVISLKTNGFTFAEQSSYPEDHFIPKIKPSAAISFKQLRKLQLIGGDRYFSSQFFSNIIHEHSLMEELMINNCSLSDFMHLPFVSNITKLVIESSYCVKATLVLLIQFPKLTVFKCHLKKNTQRNHFFSPKTLSTDVLSKLAAMSNLKKFHLEFVDDETKFFGLASVIKRFKSLKILSLKLYLRERASKRFKLNGHTLIDHL